MSGIERQQQMPNAFARFLADPVANYLAAGGKSSAGARSIGIENLRLLLITDDVQEATTHIRRQAIEAFGLGRRVRPSALLGERPALEGQLLVRESDAAPSNDYGRRGGFVRGRCFAETERMISLPRPVIRRRVCA